MASTWLCYPLIWGMQHLDADVWRDPFVASWLSYARSILRHSACMFHFIRSCIVFCSKHALVLPFFCFFIVHNTAIQLNDFSVQRMRSVGPQLPLQLRPWMPETEPSPPCISNLLQKECSMVINAAFISQLIRIIVFLLLESQPAIIKIYGSKVWSQNAGLITHLWLFCVAFRVPTSFVLPLINLA